MATKLYIPPPRRDLVARPQLLGRLGAGLAGPLILLSAPAGSGKTTLLAEWCACPDNRDLPVAWLSLDGDDNDRWRFWTHVVAALRTLDGCGLALEPATLLLQSQPPAPDQLLLTALVNGIAAATRRFILVLDDYHAIQQQPVHDGVAYLVDHLPAQMRLFISTRADPPLPLGRWRARGQLAEVRGADLRFSLQEAAAFLEQTMGLNLPAQHVAVLAERTEGWVAGLQLAALSLHGRDVENAARFIATFSGRHHFVLDYLTDEVLERQPKAVQAFLLQTSIAERLSAPLCDALRLGGMAWPESSQSILRDLEHANLFLVPLDEERRWFRYHQLFAELLRARLQETSPELVPELHRQAAIWLDGHGFVDEAVQHALAAEDFDLAVKVIERSVSQPTAWSTGDMAKPIGWLKALPDALVQSRPWLRFYRLRMLYAGGEFATADRLLHDLERSLSASEFDPANAPDAERLLGAIMERRAMHAAVQGRVREGVDLGLEALRRLPEDYVVARYSSATAAGVACLIGGDVAQTCQHCRQALEIARAGHIYLGASTAAWLLAEAQIMQGRLHEAQRTCEEALAWSTIGGLRLPAAGVIALALGQVLYERDELQAAEGCLVESLELLTQAQLSDNFGEGYALLARTRQALGDAEGAREAMGKAVERAQASHVERIRLAGSARQARLWLQRHEHGLAGVWAREYRQLQATEYSREYEELTLARVLLAQGEGAAALSLLEDLRQGAEAACRMGRLIEILALRALALNSLGEEQRALDSLNRALLLAEPEGYVRVFADEGPPMAALLRTLYGRQPAAGPAYLARILAALGAAPAPATRTHVSAGELVEPLSSRELEVLQLLAQGLTNEEVGQRLVVTLATVKSHTLSIYGKLDVHSRRQAVAAATRLGLLP